MNFRIHTLEIALYVKKKAIILESPERLRKDEWAEKLQKKKLLGLSLFSWNSAKSTQSDDVTARDSESVLILPGLDSYEELFALKIWKVKKFQSIWKIKLCDLQIWRILSQNVVDYFFYLD